MNYKNFNNLITLGVVMLAAGIALPVVFGVSLPGLGVVGGAPLQLGNVNVPSEVNAGSAFSFSFSVTNPYDSQVDASIVAYAYVVNSRIPTQIECFYTNTQPLYFTPSETQSYQFTVLVPDIETINAANLGSESNTYLFLGFQAVNFDGGSAAYENYRLMINGLSDPEIIEDSGIVPVTPPTTPTPAPAVTPAPINPPVISPVPSHEPQNNVVPVTASPLNYLTLAGAVIAVVGVVVQKRKRA